MNAHTLTDNRHTSGFTLIETLVAISILLVAIAGPLTIAARGIAAAGFAKQQLTATYLAQEAVEHIRAIRDSNVIEGLSWLEGFDACLGVTCTIEYTGIMAPCGGPCAPLSHNASSGLYGYSTDTGWEPTTFRRTVILRSEGTNADEYEIEVSVTWSSGFVPDKTITMRERIFDPNL